MPQEVDRTLAEDLASPVEIQPGHDDATPADWDWRSVGTSQPNKATFHISHSDVGRVTPDVLRPSDSPPNAAFAIAKDIPIVVIDSLDKYWAGESRKQLPLNGLRVPVEADTLEEAKRALAIDLAAQLRLLLLLATNRQGKIAPHLKENLTLLSQYLGPHSKPPESTTGQG